VPAACFICSECGAVDLPEHVVLDRPCPKCDAPNESMGLVQCAECLDPVVPTWDDEDFLRGRTLSLWAHASYKGVCSSDKRRKDMLTDVSVIPLVGMRAVVTLESGGVFRGVFGRVSSVRTGRFHTVKILRDDGGATNASLRPDGRWMISGHPAGKPAGSVTFFTSRFTR
jgi:hypothetical protein